MKLSIPIYYDSGSLIPRLSQNNNLIDNLRDYLYEDIKDVFLTGQSNKKSFTTVDFTLNKKGYIVHVHVTDSQGGSLKKVIKKSMKKVAKNVKMFGGLEPFKDENGNAVDKTYRIGFSIE